MNRRLDPEPFTVIVGIAAIVGGTASTVGYWRTHHKPLPHKTRGKLLRRLDQLAAEVRYLRTDVEEMESIFQRAEYPQGRMLRLGNGAQLTLDEFRRYETLADKVFARLKKVNKLTLQVQGLAFELPFIDKGQQANAAGEALDRVDALVRSRDYSVDKAWRELHSLVEELESMIKQLNGDLEREA